MKKFNLKNEKIDLVYFWCDSNDKEWSNQRLYWQRQLNVENNIENSTDECRFRSHDELKYSLRSIEKFAPWINRIFIVTDNQIPTWLDTKNPKIKVVFHKDFIEPEYLPCYNAIALEFHLQKIPSLSEYFLLANDDMFLGRKAKKHDFYTKSGKIIERVKKLNYKKEEIENKEEFINSISIDFDRSTFLSNAAMFEHFGLIPNYSDSHNITAYKKSLIKECCEIFKEEVHKTCLQKFRTGNCIQRIIYSYYADYKNQLEKRVFDSKQQEKIMSNNFENWFKKPEYITLHLGKPYSMYSPECIIKKKPLLFCVNDTIDALNRHYELFDRMINRYFPKKSSFEQEQVHICLSCDENYALHCTAAILSIIKNADKNAYLNFYVLNTSLIQKTKDKMSKTINTAKSNIKFIQINENDFKLCPLPKNLYFSIETYFRLKIASIFKDLDKVLYIDSDTITKGNILELWNIDITDYYAAACKDVNNPEHMKKFIDPHKYFNAGIMLINCKKWRENDIEQKCFEFIKQYNEDIIYVDQDVLNSVLLGGIKFFDANWNAEYNPLYDLISYLYKEKEMNLIHYISRNKPWNTDVENKYAKYYYKYAFQTPWKLQTLKNYVNNVILTKFLPVKNFIDDLKIAKQLKQEVKNNRVVLWGASMYLKHLVKFFNVNSPEIIGIIDRDKNKTGTKIGRYKIYPPEAITTLAPDKIISSVVNHPKMEQYIKKELELRNLNINIDAELFTK